MGIYEQFYQGLTTTSAQATMAAATQLARQLPENCILALKGDLGAGKTTFVKGMAMAWGITDTVTSPSFNLYSIYQGQRQLVHVDLYRLSGPGDWDSLMIEEFLRCPYCLAIEWPERLGNRLPADAIHLEITIDSQHHHHLRLRPPADFSLLQA